MFIKQFVGIFAMSKKKKDMLTDEERVNRGKEIAHRIILEIGNDELINRTIRSELHRHMLSND